jgi:hypothetical protein
VTISLDDDAFALERVKMTPASERGFELFEREHHARIGRASRSIVELTRMVMLEEQDPAGANRAVETGMKRGANRRRQVGPDGDDPIPARFTDIPGG